MSKKKLTLKILFFLIFCDFLETFTHFCFKKGVLSVPLMHGLGPGDLVGFFVGVFSSYFLWLGLASVLLTFIIWSTLLSRIDLSVAVPVASFSYILIPLVAIIFLHEKVTWLRWGGIIFILTGVIFVSVSSKEKETHTA